MWRHRLNEDGRKRRRGWRRRGHADEFGRIHPYWGPVVGGTGGRDSRVKAGHGRRGRHALILLQLRGRGQVHVSVEVHVLETLKKVATVNVVLLKVRNSDLVKDLKDILYHREISVEKW